MIVGIVLAAGMSTRFPGNKLFYKWWNKPVIKHTVDNILNSMVDKVVVVTGYLSDRLKKLFVGTHSEKLVFTYNPDYARGMSSSVKTGIKYVVENYSDVEAVFITPGDCAWIPPVIYDLMIMEFREKEPLILVASYHGINGHPILFNSVLLNELLTIKEETRGLKSIVKKYWWIVKKYEVHYPGVILDIDTYNDLNRVKSTIMK